MTERRCSEARHGRPECAVVCSLRARVAELEAKCERLREAVERIANHGTDLPAAECATEELCDGYRQGIYSCARIARAAIKETPDE